MIKTFKKEISLISFNNFKKKVISILYLASQVCSNLHQPKEQGAKPYWEKQTNHHQPHTFIKISQRNCGLP